MTNSETPEVLVETEETTVTTDQNTVEEDAAVETAATDDSASVADENTDSDTVVDESVAVESEAAVTEDAESAVEGEGEEDLEEEAPPTNPKWKWYVVNTYSGYENRAHQCLLDRIKAEGVEDMFGQILIPTENVVEVKQGAKRTTARKFFPGYMLVQMEMTTESWHLVKATQKITGFVGGTSRLPRPIREAEVLRITQQMTDGAERPRPKQTFQEGTQVRVTDGPFLNFTGTVEEVRPEKQKLRVLVSIFGRATPVELDFIQVERV